MPAVIAGALPPTLILCKKTKKITNLLLAFGKQKQLECSKVGAFGYRFGFKRGAVHICGRRHVAPESCYQNIIARNSTLSTQPTFQQNHGDIGHGLRWDSFGGGLFRWDFLGGTVLVGLFEWDSIDGTLLMGLFWQVGRRIYIKCRD